MEKHIGAVFPDQHSAVAAVDALRDAGLAEEHLGVAVHHSEVYALEEDVDAELVHGMERGIAIGAPIGAIAGMTLLALAVPGLGTLGVGGILAAGGVTGALAGGFWGAYLGLTAEEPKLNEEWDWERLDLQSGEVLLVVSGHGHPDQVTSLLLSHGGRLVVKPAHIS